MPLMSKSLVYVRMEQGRPHDILRLKRFLVLIFFWLFVLCFVLCFDKSEGIMHHTTATLYWSDISVRTRINIYTQLKKRLNSLSGVVSLESTEALMFFNSALLHTRHVAQKKELS